MPPGTGATLSSLTWSKWTSAPNTLAISRARSTTRGVASEQSIGTSMHFICLEFEIRPDRAARSTRKVFLGKNMWHRHLADGTWAGSPCHDFLGEIISPAPRGIGILPMVRARHGTSPSDRRTGVASHGTGSPYLINYRSRKQMRRAT